MSRGLLWVLSAGVLGDGPFLPLSSLSGSEIFLPLRKAGNSSSLLAEYFVFLVEGYFHFWVERRLYLDERRSCYMIL